MSRAEFTNWAVDEAGNVVASAAFEVRWRSNASLVTTVYQAASGAGTVSNPGTATSGGLVNFWLPYGEYEVTIGSGASAVTIPFDASPATGVPRSFATRAAAVTEWAAMVDRSETPPVGTVWTAEGLSYRYTGVGTDVPGLAGWVPHSMIAESKHFGAVCDGSTDDTAAIQAMGAWFNKGNTGYDVRFSEGTSVVSSGFTPETNGVIFGYGEGSKIQMALGHSELLEKRISDLSPSDFLHVHSFEIIGDWGGITDHTDAAYQNYNAGSSFIVIYDVKRQIYQNLRMSYYRDIAVVARNAEVLRFIGNTVEHGAKEGLNGQGENFVYVQDNFFRWLDDDCVNVSVTKESGGGELDSGNPVEYACVVTNNMAFQTADIKVASVQNTLISGNILRHMKSDGIAFAGNSPHSQSAPLSVVRITDNQITDVFDRTSIDAVTTNSQYIRLTTTEAVAGLAGGFPGEDDGAGAVVPVYEYLHVNEDSVTRSPNMRLIIANNVIGRTAANVTNYSDYGYGEFWTRDGWLDPAITDSELQSSTSIGILFLASYAEVLIHDNQFTGVYDGIVFEPVDSAYRRIDIHHNQFTDFIGVGIEVQETGRSEIAIRDNRFDGDPYHLRSTRNANGTWSASTEAIAVSLSGQIELLEGSLFRNCSQAVVNPSNVDVTRGNIVYCDPVAVGDNASNGGVRNIPAPGDGWRHVIEDSDPSSGNFQTVLNTCPLEGTAQPSSGTYLAGHFVRNTSFSVPTYSDLQPVGWHRLTTGSGHVANTDWVEVEARVGAGPTEGTYTVNLEDGSGNVSATTATGYWRRRDGWVTVTVQDISGIDITGMTGTDSLRINMPFANATGRTVRGTALIAAFASISTGGAGTSDMIGAQLNSGGDYLTMTVYDATGSAPSITVANSSGGTIRHIEITYKVS